MVDEISREISIPTSFRAKILQKCARASIAWGVAIVLEKT